MTLSPSEVANRLGVGDLARGQSQKVHSPLRDERTPSLNVTHAKDGKWLFKDHGDPDATFNEIRAALANGTGSFSVNGAMKTRKQRARTTLADIDDLTPLEWWETYTGVPRDEWEVLGCDEDERSVLFEFPGVDACKARRKGQKQIDWRGTTSPPIWPLVEETLPAEIAITEGESDCGVLRHLGLHAYTPTKGAAGTGESGLNAEVLRTFKDRGAERVVVVGDTDSSGRAFRASVISSAQAVGLECAYVDLTPECDPTLGEKDIRALFLKHGKHVLKVIAERTVEVDPARPRVDTLAQMLSWADEEIDYLVDGLIVRGTKTLVGAPTKSLKTWFMLHLVACCSTGSRLLGVPEYAVTTPVRVLLVEEEGERQLFGRRVRKVLNGIGRPLVVEPIFRFRRGFNLLDEAQVTELIACLVTEHADVLILDPLQRITPGIDENSNSDMRRVWDAVNRIILELPSVAVIVVAHNRKGDDLGFDAVRGASLSAGEQDLGIFIRKQDDFERTETTYRGTLAITLEGRELPQEFTKKGGAMEVEYLFDHDADSFAMQATGHLAITIKPISKETGKTNETAVFKAVQHLARTTSHGVPKEDVAEVTDLAVRTVEKHLARLTRDARLRRIEIPQEKGGVKAVWEVSHDE